MSGLICFFLFALKLFTCDSHVHFELQHHNWTRSEKLDPNGIFNLQWHIRNNEIVFEVTLNSRGFFALGFPYSDSRIKGFDSVFGWVNDKTGRAQILVIFLINKIYAHHSKITLIIDLLSLKNLNSKRLQYILFEMHNTFFFACFRFTHPLTTTHTISFMHFSVTAQRKKIERIKNVKLKRKRTA